MNTPIHKIVFNTPLYRSLPLVLAVFFVLLASSCSKKQFPATASNRQVVSSREFQHFLKNGAELNLNTKRTRPQQIINTAKKYLGTPHCMGGASKKCMDCSGLTYLTFAKNNITIPRRSQDQARYGKIIFRASDLKKGDLVFFTNSYKSSDYITHVGLYLGNHHFIHTSTSQGVTITPMHNTWWLQRFVFGTRVF